MSPESDRRVNRAAGRIATLGSRAVSQPLAEQSRDLVVSGMRMSPAEILAHQLDAGLEQVERRPEGIGDRRTRG
jgi:hypothetical protein